MSGFGPLRPWAVMMVHLETTRIEGVQSWAITRFTNLRFGSPTFSITPRPWRGSSAF
jgi:hypothetical protein